MELEHLADMLAAARKVLDPLEEDITELPMPTSIAVAQRHDSQGLELLVWAPTSDLPVSVDVMGQSLPVRYAGEVIPYAPFAPEVPRALKERLAPGEFAFDALNSSRGPYSLRTLAEVAVLSLYIIQPDDRHDELCLPVGLFAGRTPHPSHADSRNGVRLIYIPTTATPDMLNDNYQHELREAFLQLYRQEIEPVAGRWNSFSYGCYQNNPLNGSQGMNIGDLYIVVSAAQKITPREFFFRDRVVKVFDHSN